MSESFRLAMRDGRRVAASEYGDPLGVPVFYFHGFPGSRLEAELGHAAAVEQGVRLIALDRPGFGRSDPLPGRSLSDWPKDVADAADRLRLDRFVVAGCSGGGPYAAACAAALPERLRGVGILCGLGPPESRRNGGAMMWHNRKGLWLAEHAPWLVRPVLGAVSGMLTRFTGVAIANLKRHVTPPDRRTLDDPRVHGILAGSFREAFARGGAGAAADALIYGRPWDFDLKTIRVPVRLWHGERDVVVPPSAARWVQSRIPGSKATFYEEEGHFSLITRRLGGIFAELGAGG